MCGGDSAVERAMPEVVSAFKALFNERRRKLADWVQVMPVVQWALNAPDRERYQACPFKKRWGFGASPGRRS